MPSRQRRWGDDLTTVLNNAAGIRTRRHLEGTIVATTRIPTDRPPSDQRTHFLYNYLAARDWEIIDDPNSSDGKRKNRIVHRLKNLGVERASEDGLVKHAVSLILDAEHKITYESNEAMNGRYTGEEGDVYQEHLDVYFNEGNKNRWVPRAILVDLNMQDLHQITSDSLGQLYRPDNVIGNDEGSANCYAKAFRTVVVCGK